MYIRQLEFLFIKYQLVASVLNGFLFGAFGRKFSVPHWSPPHFVLVFFVAFFGNSVAPTLADQPRTTFLAVMVGLPSIFNVVFGLLTGSMCGTYLCWILALAVVAALDLQVLNFTIYTSVLHCSLMSNLSSKSHCSNGDAQ